MIYDQFSVSLFSGLNYRIILFPYIHGYRLCVVFALLKYNTIFFQCSYLNLMVKESYLKDASLSLRTFPGKHVEDN